MSVYLQNTTLHAKWFKRLKKSAYPSNINLLGWPKTKHCSTELTELSGARHIVCRGFKKTTMAMRFIVYHQCQLFHYIAHRLSTNTHFNMLPATLEERIPFCFPIFWSAQWLADRLNNSYRGITHLAEALILERRYTRQATCSKENVTSPFRT